MSDDKTRVLTQEELTRLAGGAVVADDGRTRVLSAAELERLVAAQPATPSDPAPERAAAARPQAAPPRDPAELPAPRFVDGKVIFFCSQGHKIVVDAALAGKRGKCSKAGCGVPVVIPAPPAADTPADAAPAAVPEAVASEPAPPTPAVAPEPPTPEPAAAGVPAPPEPVEPAATAEEAASWDFMSGGASDAEAAAPDLGLEAPAAVPGAWGDVDADVADNPTARLLARLWIERDHGGIVELHLAGGSVLVPEWYEPRWSRGTHGLFASQAPDGTVTLTAVAWDTIQKIIVRKVNGLPDGMF